MTAGNANNDARRTNAIVSAIGTLFLLLMLPGLASAQTLVGYWTFDGNAADTSGFSNNGTIYGSTSFTTGRLGLAIDLSGRDNYVKVLNSLSLQTSTFSVAYWAKLNYAQNPVIASKRDSTDSSSAWQVSITSFNNLNQDLQLCLFTPGVDCYYSPTIVPSPVDRWTHVAATYDGSVAKLYVDGVLAKSEFASFDPGAGTGDIMIGDWINGGHNYDGLLDDVRIYDLALSAPQVAALAHPLTDKDQCKNGGWQTLSRSDGSSFKNQGDCIQYVNTGK